MGLRDVFLDAPSALKQAVISDDNQRMKRQAECLTVIRLQGRWI